MCSTLPSIGAEIFKNAHVYFGGGSNNRVLEETVILPPATLSFKSIIVNVRVHCPNQRCDWWDRKGSLSLLTPEGEEVELMRFMTPYRVGASWSLDITDLRPLLSGLTKFRLFIDTWVGPGHAQGDGWLVDASLHFIEGSPAREVLKVVPILAPISIEYGNPEVPAQNIQEVFGVAGSSGAKLRVYVTGHGQGNTENCAEFCPKSHSIQVGDWSTNQIIWRNNCRETVTDGPQKGTWIYDRAGWCPGDKVLPWDIEIPTTAFAGADTVDILWSTEPYINVRRGDYNGGGHTMPYYRVSSILILYR